MTERCLPAAPSRQHGQAAAEFIVVGVLFLAMFSGLVEMTYVYRAKHLLNSATFEAARTGALHNAKVEPMQAMLAQGMAPLYMRGARNLSGLQDAVARANEVLTAMEDSTTSPDTAPLQIISPTKLVYDAFKEIQDVRLADQAVPKLQDVIPNDNLEWRSRDPQTITVGNTTMTVNLQDANLLKIRTFWCQPLIVPGLDSVVHSIITQEFTPSPQQQMCDAAGAKLNAQIAANTAGYQSYYVAIESSAVIRMQSPVVGDDLQ
jgi:hypothetical protein